MVRRAGWGPCGGFGLDRQINRLPQTTEVNIQLNLTAILLIEDGIGFKATFIINNSTWFRPPCALKPWSQRYSLVQRVCVYPVCPQECVFVRFLYRLPTGSTCALPTLPVASVFSAWGFIKDFLLSGFEKEQCRIEQTILSQKSGLLFMCAKFSQRECERSETIWRKYVI